MAQKTVYIRACDEDVYRRVEEFMPHRSLASIVPEALEEWLARQRMPTGNHTEPAVAALLEVRLALEGAGVLLAHFIETHHPDVVKENTDPD